MKTEWPSGWPDWRDSGKRVCFQTADDTVRCGILEAADMFFNGDDEVPIFSVDLDSGGIVSFADAARWRFEPATSSDTLPAEAK